MTRATENHRVLVLFCGCLGCLFAPGLFQHQLVKFRSGTQHGKLLILH